MKTEDTKVLGRQRAKPSKIKVRKARLSQQWLGVLLKKLAKEHS